MMALLAATAPVALARAPAAPHANASVTLDLGALDELRPDPLPAKKPVRRIALHRPRHKPAHQMLAVVKPAVKPIHHVAQATFGAQGNVTTVAALTPPPAAAPQPRPAAQPVAMQIGALAPLHFAPGAAEISGDARQALDKVAAQLRANPSLHLDVVAFAGGTPEQAIDARRLSLQRAIDVRAYLVAQGVQGGALTVRAMGNRDAGDAPADRVDLVVRAR